MSESDSGSDGEGMEFVVVPKKMGKNSSGERLTPQKVAPQKVATSQAPPPRAGASLPSQRSAASSPSSANTLFVIRGGFIPYT